MLRTTDRTQVSMHSPPTCLLLILAFDICGHYRTYVGHVNKTDYFRWRWSATCLWQQWHSLSWRHSSLTGSIFPRGYLRTKAWPVVACLCQRLVTQCRMIVRVRRKLASVSSERWFSAFDHVEYGVHPYRPQTISPTGISATTQAISVTKKTRNQKHRRKRDNAYRQKIVTRICSYTWVELITISIVTIRSRPYLAQTLRQLFTFWKISTAN